MIKQWVHICGSLRRPALNIMVSLIDGMFGIQAKFREYVVCFGITLIIVVSQGILAGKYIIVERQYGRYVAFMIL